MLPRPDRGGDRTKAICFPSGDHSGLQSTAVSVVKRRLSGSPMIFSQMSELFPVSPVDRKAIWFPSGEKLPC